MSTSAPPTPPPAIIAVVEVETRLCLWCTLVTDDEAGLDPQVRYEYS